MRIQFLSWKQYNFKNVECRLLGDPNAFDSFDINVIDLSYHGLWVCNDSILRKCRYIQDIQNIRSIIESSKCKKIILILPQDCNVNYHFGIDPYSHQKAYLKSERLKNALSYFNDNLRYIGVNFTHGFTFENNKYLINNKEFHSSFFFSEHDGIVLQKAIDSGRPITIKNNDLLCTFLDVNNEDMLFLFIKDLGLISEEKIPEWLGSLTFFDDEKLKKDIEEQNALIRNAKEKINNDSLKLDENNYYKLILSTNDNDLVVRVFKILDEMLGTGLSSSFVDEKKEDFLFKKTGMTFIGEIKGVSTNVKNEHISQVDNHKSIYEDQLQEEGKTETIKKILIINHQRKVDIFSREPIHINQRKKAEKENTLIIETITLLKLFDKFKKGEIDTASVIKLFKEEAGVLQINE